MPEEKHRHTAQAKYQEWLRAEELGPELKEELEAIQDQPEEIAERFAKDLAFGTAGLRGILGAGTNRMNIWTVGMATQAFAEVMLDEPKEKQEKGVVISYDVRHFSRTFAEEAASIFAANGIPVFLYKEMQATPLVSYTILQKQVLAGVMVTASHNPKEYNGYKVYWDNGAQIGEEIAKRIEEKRSLIKDFLQIKRMPLDDARKNGLLIDLGEEIPEQYLEEVMRLSLAKEEEIDKDFSIVYTAMHGCGREMVPRVLKQRGFRNVHLVEEQLVADPDFSTVSHPNPEDSKAFAMAEALGKKYGAKLLIATDPDADRIALGTLGKDGSYLYLSGNQTGILFTNYILEMRAKAGTLPENAAVIKSVVTSDAIRSICKDYQVEVVETLTGFKNIFAPLEEWEENKKHSFLFGFEESIGYSYGTFVRDKDAISSALLLAEMAAYYAKKGKSLEDVLKHLYHKYAYFGERSVSHVWKGEEGQARMARVMDALRDTVFTEFLGRSLLSVTDYLHDDTGLPPSNVLQFTYEEGFWFAIRPSGTEPKLKMYIYSKEKTKDFAQELVDEAYYEIMNYIKSIK